MDFFSIYVREAKTDEQVSDFKDRVDEWLGQSEPRDLAIVVDEDAIICSYFIGFVARYQRKVRERGGRMVIVAPQESVARQIFCLTRLDDRIPLVNTIDDVPAVLESCCGAGEALVS